MDESYRVTNIIQAKFRLNNGDILYANIKDGFMYFKKDNQTNNIDCTVQPKVGSSATYTSSEEIFETSFTEMISKYDAKFYWGSSDSIKPRKLNIFDKIADKINHHR